MSISGVLHIHSTYSYDGKVPLRELKKLFVQQGLQFACMSEHTDKLTDEQAAAFAAECRKLSDETFVFVPGFEVPYKDAHVLHLGTDTFICQFADENSLQLWREVTPLVVLAHPVRNHFKIDQTLEEVIDGVEIWNQQYEGKHAPRFRSLSFYKALQQKNPSLIATGGLDLHRVDHLGSPTVVLDTEELSEASILLALKNGLFLVESRNLSVTARAEWQVGNKRLAWWRSGISIIIINLGKFVNATLARLGWRLPKLLTQVIRARV